ncbi:MAG: flagellar protein FlgN [Clostridium sp.]|nr:flagellar protein FlgN [Clostridium sp.]MCM1547798.1 flagellar protein FlgN [Ruminococcus sp.]
MKNFEEFYSFMLEYTEFFEETAVKEREKMSALLSDDLNRIEKCLNEHQTTIKKTEIYEAEREKLQAKLGLDGKSFRQIMVMTEGEEYDMLKKLYIRFRAAVDNVSHSNKTSLQIAETNMRIIESMTASVNDAKCYDSNGISAKRRNMGLLNKKI